jgi:flagellar biosynthetic protein FlhB
MAEQQQEQNRTEPATPFKLREARRRGQVAKSLEINSFVMLTTVLVVLYFAGERLIMGQLAISRSIFSQIHAYPLAPSPVIGLFQEVGGALLGVLWPFIGAVMVAGILASLFQTGPIFSFFPLKPDVQRLNPARGFKRLFSVKLLFESVKSVVKLGLFGFAIYLAVLDWIPDLLSLLDTSPKVYGAFLLDRVRALMFTLLLVVLLIALIDLAYTRWDYSNQMRMSRRELKEEIKRREGDPRIRAKMRELQREAAKRAGSLQKVPDADVLITNPQHLSVALRYERGAMTAPQVTAKGGGDLALKMREVARIHHVPVIENKMLARILFTRVDIDQMIPEEHYPLVAKILLRAYAMRDARDADGRGAPGRVDS